MDRETRAYIDEHFGIIDGYIEQTDKKLVAIARQNASLSEMVEVLGGFTNTVVQILQDHVGDGHGGRGEDE